MNTQLNRLAGRRALIDVMLAAAQLLFLAQLNLLAQSTPHHFTAIKTMPDKTVALSLDGSVPTAFASFYDLHVIETSPNLTDWTPLTTLLRTNTNPNALVFTEPNATQFGQRFYRTFTNHLITAFPKPTGPYAVGTFSRLVTDPSQTDRFGIPGNSSFMVSFWYPAEAKAQMLPSGYVAKNLAEDSGTAALGFNTQITPQLTTHSLSEAPVTGGQTRFPVLIHSHGRGLYRQANTPTAEELASHGYIVAAMDHLDCYATQFSDGQYLHGTGGVGVPATFIPSRIQDVQFVLEELGRMNAGASPLAGRIDLQRIGLMGMSLGGSAAAEMGRTDPRVKCVALLDGSLKFPVNAQLQTAGVGKPFLAMNNTDDPSKNFWSDTLTIFGLATTDAIRLKINGATHLTFMDVAWIVQNTATSRRAASAMDACLLSFFNHYLKGEDDHGFEASGGQPAPIQRAYPEIVELSVK